MKKALPYIVAALVFATGLIPVTYGVTMAFRSGYAWIKWPALGLGLIVLFQVGRAAVSCCKGFKTVKNNIENNIK